MENENSYNIRYKGITSPPHTPEVVQVRDTFQTPNYAVDLLIPYIPKDIKMIWEPACGMGKIVSRLEHHGFKTFATDIRWNDYQDFVYNFVTEYGIEQVFEEKCAIITNPPYSLKSEFISKALDYDVPFAFLINADYSGQQIEWIRRRGCEKIIPTRRINYITPSNRQGETSSAQFHSMWLTYKFNLGRTETFVDLPIKEIKENI